MNIDVENYIAELLFENESVIVPGLGGFISRYKPATVDQAGGKLFPPSKELNFNNNLVVNDGVLINFIKEKHHLTYAQAEKAVQDYAGQVNAAIERREIVVFPRVGRLYKDYQQKMQFLPDNTNFNTDSFGLPNIAFHPITQVHQVVTPKIAAPPGKTEPAQPPLSTVIADWFQRYLAAIGAVSAIVIAFGIYFIIQDFNKPSPLSAEETGQIPETRINIKPSTVQPGEAEDAPTIADDPEDLSDLEGENTDPDGIDTEAITTPPEQHYVIIAIGLFGDKKNINALVEKIYKAGYEPYLEDVGNVTRIGIQKTYEQSGEVKEILKDVREQFNKDAFVFRLR